MTSIINDSILFELTFPFCFFLFFFVSQIYQTILYLEIVFACTTFYRFYFSFVCIYAIVQTVHVYMYEYKKKYKLCFLYKSIRRLVRFKRLPIIQQRFVQCTAAFFNARELYLRSLQVYNACTILKFHRSARSKVASNTKAKTSGILVVDILRKSFWLNTLPFKNFYHKEIWPDDTKFQSSNL